MTSQINIRLSENEREMLSDLALRVRTFSVDQVKRTWPGVVGKLAKLEKAGLLVSHLAVVHPELSLEQPIIQWNRGEVPPDFSKASYQLRSRWKHPAVFTKCIIATKMTGRMFGGHGGRYPRESEVTHDLHLASIFLRFRADFPSLMATWVHEEEFKRDRKQRRGKVPDVVVDKRKVVEFGGAYKKAKLISFHNFCESRGFEYEVW